MPLEVQQVEKGDLPTIAALDQLVMKENGTTQVIWHIQDEEGIERTAAFTSFISSGMEKHGDTFWKVVDTDIGSIISVAKFMFHYEKADESMATTLSDGPRPNPRLIDFFRESGAVGDKWAKEHFTGRPHAHLDYLITHPEHERRGAGSMLLKKATEKADAAGLDMFLRASAAGAGLYKKFGFEEEKRQYFDFRPWGLDKTEVKVFMKRAVGGNDSNQQRGSRWTVGH